MSEFNPPDPQWSAEQIDALRNTLPTFVPPLPGIDPDVSQDPNLYAGEQLLAAALPALGTKGRMVYAAQRHLGEIEVPYGSNKCPTCRWYNANVAKIGNGPYCDMGVTRASWESGNAVAVCGGKGRGFALTTAHAADFQRRGLWHWSAAGIDEGDVAFFSWSRGRRISDIEHTETVEKQLGAHKRSTIGFNVANGVHRETRDDTYIVGYGRPPYAKSPAPAAAGDSWFMGVA